MDGEREFVFDDNFDESIDEISRTDIHTSDVKSRNPSTVEKQNSTELGNKFDDSSDGDDDYSDDDDDDDEKDSSCGILHGESVHAHHHGRRRPTVREHSKAQREKRKRYQSKLEEQAIQLTREIENELEMRNARFEALREANVNYRQKSEDFLKLWFSENPCNFESHSRDRSLTWDQVVEPVDVMVTTPVSIIHFTPPFPVDDQRITIYGLENLKSYLAGFHHMCTSIARFGNNVTSSLMLFPSLKPEFFAIEGNRCTASYVVNTKNAILCGGSYEICFGGKHHKSSDISLFFFVRVYRSQQFAKLSF